MSKNILFITAFPPNSKTAGQNYSQLLLNDLVNKGYKIDLVYCSYPGHELEVNSSVNVLKCFSYSKKNIIRNILFFPLFSKRFDKKILNYLQSISNQYFALYFDFSQVHIYAKYINHPLKILMCHDVIYQKTKRQIPFLILYEKWSEKKLLKTGDLILTFSTKDSELIKKIYKLDSKPVNFYLKNSILKDLPDTKKNEFCFYGAWNRKENWEILLWFINKVMPKINKPYKYKIIGGGLGSELQQIIKQYPEFEYIGFVDNPVIEVSKYQALIAPLLHGAGVKVKVIDALTSGTKVIGSPIAFEGISDNSVNQIFYKCCSPKEFADVLNNWESSNKEKKLLASEEFFSRYNTNHLPQILENYIN